MEKELPQTKLAMISSELVAEFLFNVVHVRANATELEFHDEQASTMEAADVRETVNYAINMWIGQCVFF